ncbi:TrbC/VirB2 family protein [Agrobacterium tumefaciens]|uniref:TrbC/VirB2 family protein n=1 Tax=Agrobacterium tumefaciens TaxID=358 RepID=UPI00389958F4
MIRSKKLANISLAIALVATAQIVTADPVFAQGATAFAPLSSALQMIVDFIQGPFGRLLAIIAVTSLGILAFIGRLSVMLAGGVILGIGIVFGAPDIVDQLISGVGK